MLLSTPRHRRARRTESYLSTMSIRLWKGGLGEAHEGIECRDLPAASPRAPPAPAEGGSGLRVRCKVEVPGPFPLRPASLGCRNRVL